MGNRKKAQKTKRESSVSQFLREVCLSPIGNREPFKLKLLSIHSAGVIEKMAEDLAGLPIFIYRQGALGEIKQVIGVCDGEDKTAIFKEEMRKFEAFLKANDNELPLVLKNFEIIKALNFYMEEAIKTEVLHIVISEQDVEALIKETEAIELHWHQAYGSVKPIEITVGEEEIEDSGNGPTFH